MVYTKVLISRTTQYTRYVVGKNESQGELGEFDTGVIYATLRLFLRVHPSYDGGFGTVRKANRKYHSLHFMLLNTK